MLLKYTCFYEGVKPKMPSSKKRPISPKTDRCKPLKAPSPHLDAIVSELRPGRSYATSIRLLRENCGLNQAEFAKVFKVSQAAVSAWERGEYPPSSEMLLKMGNLEIDSNALGFFKAAGIDIGKLFRVVGNVLRVLGVPPTSEQIAKIPELGKPAIEVLASVAAHGYRVRVEEVIDLIDSGVVKGRTVGGSYIVEYDSLADYMRKSQRG